MRPKSAPPISPRIESPSSSAILKESSNRTPKAADFIFGKKAAYVDLSLFQMIERLRYAFPKTMAPLEPQHARLVTLHDRVMARPRVAAYLSSPRRLAFNEQGIFRHYPELEEG